MFAFRLVVDGCLVGDDEPFILGSLMWELQHRPSFDSGELPDVGIRSADAAKLLTDDESRLQDDRYEAAMLRGAESLDRWLVWLYADGAHGVALAQAVADDASARAWRHGLALATSVPFSAVRCVTGRNSARR